MTEEGRVATQLSGGIIEISAVATLIGAPIAESMTLGLKSAAALPWASITLFGMVHVAKASLAAAVPDWLREPLGLQNANVDAALGLMHELQARYPAKSRVDLGDAAGIMLFSEPKDLRKFQENRKTKDSCRSTTNAMCVYNIDRTARLILDTIPDAEYGRKVILHQFMPDDGHTARPFKDVFILLMSLCKVAESATLRYLGANELWILTSIIWLWSLIFAVILTITNLSRDHVGAGGVDLVVGKLPSHLTAGGVGQIVVGTPRNVRRSDLWRLFWITNFPVTLVGLVGTYIVLGGNSMKVIYCWIAFQTLWLCARILVFYISDSAAGSRQSLTVGRTWEESPHEVQKHGMQLLLALAKHSAIHHARGLKHYEHDIDLEDVECLLSHCSSVGWKLAEWTGPVNTNVPLEVLGVVGDNLLRATSWLNGAVLSNNELYDSALVFLKVEDRCLAVPAVRVICCRCPRTYTKEWAPRGDSHGSVCKNMVWCIWMPAISESNRIDSWIYASGIESKAALACEFMTTSELGNKLAQAEWQISLRTPAEFEKIVDVSRKASRLLMGMAEGMSKGEANETDTDLLKIMEEV